MDACRKKMTAKDKCKRTTEDNNMGVTKIESED